MEAKHNKLLQQVTDIQVKYGDSMKLLMLGTNNKQDFDELDERIGKEVRLKAEVAIDEVKKIKNDLIK